MEEGIEGSWYGAVDARAFREGANLDPISPVQVFPSVSLLGPEEPQFKRMCFLGLLEFVKLSFNNSYYLGHVGWV